MNPAGPLHEIGLGHIRAVDDDRPDGHDEILFVLDGQLECGGDLHRRCHEFLTRTLALTPVDHRRPEDRAGGAEDDEQRGTRSQIRFAG